LDADIQYEIPASNSSDVVFRRMTCWAALIAHHLQS